MLIVGFIPIKNVNFANDYTPFVADKTPKTHQLLPDFLCQNY